MVAEPEGKGWIFGDAPVKESYRQSGDKMKMGVIQAWCRFGVIVYREGYLIVGELQSRTSKVWQGV